MNRQVSFSELEYASKRKVTRRERFLALGGKKSGTELGTDSARLIVDTMTSLQKSRERA